MQASTFFEPTLNLTPEYSTSATPPQFWRRSCVIDPCRGIVMRLPLWQSFNFKALQRSTPQRSVFEKHFAYRGGSVAFLRTQDPLVAGNRRRNVCRKSWSAAGARSRRATVHRRSGRFSVQRQLGSGPLLYPPIDPHLKRQTSVAPSCDDGVAPSRFQRRREHSSECNRGQKTGCGGQRHWIVGSDARGESLEHMAEDQ